MEGSFKAGRLETKTALSTALGEKRQPVEEFISKTDTSERE